MSTDDNIRRGQDYARETYGQPPRAFLVRRDEDVTGISSTGVVAEGVLFSDGWVVTHWLDRPPMHEPKTDVWHHQGVEPFEKVHGHGGTTRIVWVEDAEYEARWQQVMTRRTQKLIADLFGVPQWPVDPDEPASAVPDEIVHACPPDGSGLTPCCGRTPFELPLTDRISSEAPTTCTRPGPDRGLTTADTPAEELAAAECSAQYQAVRTTDPRKCIRAGQHRGDHIDEHGFHWSDTVAVYPVIDGEVKYSRASANSCSSPEHACPTCGDCVNEHPGEGGCPVEAPEPNERLREAARRWRHVVAPVSYREQS
ncbi:hypothetical protein AB0M87_04670 [Streptomyces sp. NPDC051320]|uniref:hypothetical protein n=1 Tax=Streptomyces sp. NPDC051320 TaxID=3154644 RepID=UPI00342CD14C